MLSVWTSAVNDLSVAPSWVQVNDAAAEGLQSHQFYADNRVMYKVAVAGYGAADQGDISLRAFLIPDPFVTVTNVVLNEFILDITNNAVDVLATLTLEARREITSVRFTLLDP